MDKFLEVPGLPEAFPIPKRVADIVNKEWERPGIPFVPPPIFKKLFPMVDPRKDLWQSVPKVEGAVSTLNKRTTIPIEDSCAFKDPMDKKLEGLLKKMFVQQGYLLQPISCIVPVTTAAYFWFDELIKVLDSDSPPYEEIMDRINALKLANAFTLDATLQLARLAAKNSGFAIVARRALWLKSWSADASSKNKLLNIPFKGKTLFGPDLKEIISDITGGKGHALPQDRPFKAKNRPNFRPFRKNGPAQSATSSKQEGNTSQAKPAWRPMQGWNKGKQAKKPATATKTA
ncbi:lamina-associated polypeptide 2, isoforms alpha/zeta-like [Bombina bombina]|uniref:lamina-associated polypeptide 2, isoforms alpha/zeta-like n=1 Tax=Bombina bombina TaxID=8345 RepID=UPI00235ADA1A|nr:lamina-associated polypeptide 2, isoforms alpha/zeta-like [Bombina bombina]